MATLVNPRVQAMVLCDSAEESENEGGVYHLTGVRSVIESPFPAVVSQLSVFAQMSGHQGAASCHIEIEHAESSQVIFETESDRRASASFAARGLNHGKRKEETQIDPSSH